MSYEQDQKKQKDFERKMLRFLQAGTIEVWLFVTNERHNPVEVFPADVLGNSDAV